MGYIIEALDDKTVTRLTRKRAKKEPGTLRSITKLKTRLCTPEDKEYKAEYHEDIKFVSLEELKQQQREAARDRLMSLSFREVKAFTTLFNESIYDYMDEVELIGPRSGPNSIMQDILIMSGIKNLSNQYSADTVKEKVVEFLVEWTKNHEEVKQEIDALFIIKKESEKKA